MSAITAEREPAGVDFGKLLGPYRVLRGNRDLSLLVGGQVVSSFGDWLYITALVVLVYTLTHSATVVAALTFVRLLPYVIFLPLGGHLADRFDRRRLMIGADLGRAACMAALLAVGSRDTVWVAFPAVFAATCLFGLFRPALGATVPAVAGGEETLVAANALLSQIEGLSLVLGPSLAGLLIVLGQERVAFGVNAATYAISALTLACLRLPARREERATAGGWLGETLAGYRYLFRARGGTLGAVTLAAAPLSGFVGAFWTLSVVLSEQTWHLGGQGAGFLSAAYGVGGLLGGFVVATIASRVRSATSYTVSLGAAIILIALFGLSPAGVFPLAALALIGFACVVNDVASATLVQLGTPDELLGRVCGAFEATIIAAMLLCAVAVGPLIAALGPRAAVVVLAAAALATAAACGPRLRGLKSEV
ncbi:MAG TPA: MFS transporter [Thermomicrobiales bacterium]|nr:MFS transporter [Thermomicrobiales bacterium]